MITLLNYDNINKEEWVALTKQSSTASPFQRHPNIMIFAKPFIFGVVVVNKRKT